MPYLLDTNICIYIIKRKPVSVLQKFNAISSEEVGISAITVAELEYGIEKSQHKEQNRLALHKFLSPFTILSFNYHAAVEYGVIRATLEAKGQSIGPLDTLIAAHAKSLSWTLVTNNEQEFNRVDGVRVENWT